MGVEPTPERLPGVWFGKNASRLQDSLRVDTQRIIPVGILEKRHSVHVKFVAALFDVRAFGAVGDGRIDDTHAVRAAAAALGASDGGTLLFPRNMTVVTGPFNLTSHSVLAVQGRILGSTNGSRWPLIEAERVWPQVWHARMNQPLTAFAARACAPTSPRQGLHVSWRSLAPYADGPRV